MRRQALLLAIGVACAASVSAQSIDGYPDSRFIEQRERVTPAAGAPIELRFLIAREMRDQSPRIVAATRAAITMLSEWLGPPTAAALTVAAVPWRGDPSNERPGVVTAPVRWLAPARDRSTERALIASLVNHYWGDGASRSSFEDAIRLYTSSRAIHQLLEGGRPALGLNFETPRFFGGVVPFPLRSVVLSPPSADPRPRVIFDAAGSSGIADAGVRRAVKGLQTIERYAGWPTMLQALKRMRESGRVDPEGLAAALADVRGTDLRSLVAGCLDADAAFDYSLDGLQSAPGAAGLVETTVTISRRGPGRFAITAGGDDPEAAIPLVIRFQDGSELRDYFDGAAPSLTLVYSARTPAIAAAIDPDTMLLLDGNRRNNAIVRDAPMSPVGIRLALHWMSWLQNAMLSYTALL